MTDTFPIPTRRRFTERRRRILQFCHEYAKSHGWAASISEIMEHCDVRSHQGVYMDLWALSELGFIEYKGSRQIKVLTLP